MNAIMKAIAKGAIAILWNKKTLKWIVRYGNEELAKKIDISGKERYAEILTDALDEIRLREQVVLGKIGEVSTLATNGLATLGSQINCLATQVAGITKTVVPITAVCPQPMPQHNSWTAPTAAAT